MSTIYVNLTEAQRRAHRKAKQAGQAWTVKLTRKQVLLSSSTPTEITPDHLPLNKTQAKQHLAAVMAKKPLQLTFSAKNVKRGGFFFAILPALAALAPGLLGAAPQILDGVKQGYETIGKLAGVSPTGKQESKQEPASASASLGQSSPDLMKSQAEPKRKTLAGAALSADQIGDAIDEILGSPTKKSTGASLAMFGESLRMFGEGTTAAPRRAAKKKQTKK